MNYDKIQAQVLKSAYKRDAELKPFLYKWGKWKENFVIINEQATALFIIPEDKFYLDIDRVFKKAKPLRADKIINENDVETIILTTSQVVSEIGILGIFKHKDENIYYDTKLLKEYGKLHNPSYKGSTNISPVLIYEEEVLVGLILPVVHRKEGE